MKRYVGFASILAVLTLLAGQSTVQAQTWIELNPIGSPPPYLDRAPSNYDAANNRLIVFVPDPPAVGEAGNQVWVLTNANGLGGTPEWIRLSPSGTPPFSKALGSVAYDSLTNRLIVYGGCGGDCAPALGGVFVLTNANGLGGPPVWSQSTVTNPQNRTTHTGVYDPNSNSLIAFGGHLAFFGTDKNDTRVLSNGNGVMSPSSWSTLSPAGDPPPIRNSHTAIYDEVNNRMTVFAGSNYIAHSPPNYFISDYNDVWVLSDANGVGAPTWTQLLPAGSLPSPRSAHSAVYDPVNNRMLAFGGFSWEQTTQTHTSLDDLWLLSYANGLGGTPTWTQITPCGTPPGPSVLHSAAFDAVHQRMILSGGRSQMSGVGTNRVWVLTMPTIQSVSATPVMLWPPNHQMVPVSVTVNTADVCDSQPVCTITSVSSNELDNGLGDGDTANDIVVTGDLSVKLRAERSGKGNGRIYTINVQCEDDVGNTATGTTTVTVPRNQGKK